MLCNELKFKASNCCGKVRNPWSTLPGTLDSGGVSVLVQGVVRSGAHAFQLPRGTTAGSSQSNLLHGQSPWSTSSPTPAPNMISGAPGSGDERGDTAKLGCPHTGGLNARPSLKEATRRNEMATPLFRHLENCFLCVWTVARREEKYLYWGKLM